MAAKQTIVASVRELERLAVTQIDAAQIMSVSARTISRWEKSGLLEGKRIGGAKLYTYASLKRLVESG
jgi:DNA-binding transcriptional MerR regulator